MVVVIRIVIIIIARRARAGHAEGMRPPVPSPSPRGSAAARGRAAADRDKPGNNHTGAVLSEPTSPRQGKVWARHMPTQVSANVLELDERTRQWDIARSLRCFAQGEL